MEIKTYGTLSLKERFFKRMRAKKGVVISRHFNPTAKKNINKLLQAE